MFQWQRSTATASSCPAELLRRARGMVVVTGQGKGSATPDDAMSSSDAEDDFQEPATPTATQAGQALPLLPQQFPEVVPLNVGGMFFTTRLSTLRRYEDTMLAAMFSGRHYIPTDAEGRYFIDRDGTYFGDILNFLRSGDLPPRERVRPPGADHRDRQAARHAAEGALRQAQGVRVQGGDAHHPLRVPPLQLAALRAQRERHQALRAPLRGGRVLRALGGRGRRLRPAALHRHRPVCARHRRGPPVHRRVRQAPRQPLLLQAPHLRVQDHLVVSRAGQGTAGPPREKWAWKESCWSVVAEQRQRLPEDICSFKVRQLFRDKDF
ncbi:BTB/POZ domain-containing protein KCTD7 isoform X2 [Prinia subflava]|uniref:BTB/POZ domain-containing protein KCTD7 isoform X2 n=1 Tax=Prinia subflava TaxID=208062 RepID=UPI002FE288A6